MTDFPDLRKRNTAQLNWHLDQCNAPPQLQEAMRYSVLNGGKRIRAQLVYLSTMALGADIGVADSPAAAIELVHAYSLIHDDLPAMDDDDYRRNKPSCHIKFDEATAILAGDALQTLGFQILAEDDKLNPEIRLRMISGLTRAIGGGGMIAGQILDLSYENNRINKRQLEQMHLLKTGALISLSMEFGGMIAGADSNTQEILEQFGSALGLAFQIRDDILDATGEDEDIGKPRGSDAANQKSTFVTTLGLDVARRSLKEIVDTANDSIMKLGPGARPLQQLAGFVATRNH